MQAFLESFGSIKEIREYCKTKGVKGERLNCKQCAIANLLKLEFPERFENGEVIKVYPYGDVTRLNSDDVAIECFPTPRLIGAFAQRFDDGRFPDLVTGRS